MRKLVTAFATTALLGTASAAYAASITGDIASLNRTARTLGLDNGPTFIAPKTAKLSNFKVGEKVTVAYSMRGSGLGWEHAVSIAPAKPVGTTPTSAGDG
jgi:hypothetical protein